LLPILRSRRPPGNSRVKLYTHALWGRHCDILYANGRSPRSHTKPTSKNAHTLSPYGTDFSLVTRCRRREFPPLSSTRHAQSNLPAGNYTTLLRCGHDVKLPPTCRFRHPTSHFHDHAVPSRPRTPCPPSLTEIIRSSSRWLATVQAR
jgi:hypothetical protein